VAEVIEFTNELSVEIERLAKGKPRHSLSLKRLEMMEDLLLIASKFFRRTKHASSGLQYEMDFTVQELERLEGEEEDDDEED